MGEVKEISLMPDIDGGCQRFIFITTKATMIKALLLSAPDQKVKSVSKLCSYVRPFQNTTKMFSFFIFIFVYFSAHDEWYRRIKL